MLLRRFRLNFVRQITPYLVDLAGQNENVALVERRRWMGTRMLERSPGELHTYNINREGGKTTRRFKGIQPSTQEAAGVVAELLKYFVELIDENPITITTRNAAAMFTRLGRTETVALLGDWWFEPAQERVLTKIGCLMRRQMFRCTNEDLICALWGMSFLGPKIMDVPLTDKLNMDVLIHDLVNRILRDITKARGVDLTLFVEALARLQYKNIDFAMKAVTYETKNKIVRFSDQDLPRLLWSLAQMGYPSRDGSDKDQLLSTLAWECKKRLGAWNGIELARVIWAFAVLRFDSIQHLLSIISRQYIDRQRFRADAVVKILWGLDTLRHHPGKLILSKLGRSFVLDVESLFPRDIVTGCVALMNFGFVDDRVPTRIKELIHRSEIDGWTARDAANLIWILSRADFLEQDTFMILRRFLLQTEPGTLNAQAQAEIYRCYLHLHTFRPSLARLLPKSISEKCQKAWLEREQVTDESMVLSGVVDSLKKMDFTVEPNSALHDGLLLAHTASKSDDDRYAVEIIYPPKCFINDRTSISEQQLWREDLLLGWGWKILRVEEKRWTRIKDDREKTEFLKTLMHRA